MKRYSQLTREQRYQIYALKKAGHSQTDIADVLEFHKSTISRELKRNQGQRGYRPKQAHQGPRTDCVTGPARKSRLRHGA